MKDLENTSKMAVDRLKDYFRFSPSPARFSIMPMPSIDSFVELQGMIEGDNARTRSMHRTQLLSISTAFDDGRFMFDQDPELKDVAYLTDMSKSNPLDHQLTITRDQRKGHNRILILNRADDVIAVEFFDVPKSGVDLRGLSEQKDAAEKIARTEGVSVILGPEPTEQ